MDKELISTLEEVLNSAAKGLPKTSGKKMFGCHALWADGAVYALVWKHGRIGVKLPEPSAFEALMSLSGSEQWKAGPMAMSHWVLVPKTFHKKKDSLYAWVKKAHAMALIAGPPTKKRKNPGKKGR